MNNSYFRFIFSDLPHSVAVAFSFEVRDGDPTSYRSMWETIENNFRTSRSELIEFYYITEHEFERNLLKVDFRAK